MNLFGTNLFGTDGIRGTVGTAPFIEDHLITIGKAIAHWAITRYGEHPRLLMVYDTRISAGFVTSALTTGLLQFPITVVDAGVLPTPAAAHLMRSSKFNAALIISASHNPYQDNGIKIMDAQSGKLTLADECMISELITKGVDAHASQGYGKKELWNQGAEQYCTIIEQQFAPQLLAGKKIVLDTAHGATYHVAPAIFSKLGATVLTINNTPDGYNINEQCGALHLEQLQKTVLEHKADIGFAFDGDGDRVMTVTADGTLKDGDDVLALLSTHPTYATTAAVVGTIMSNEGLVQFLDERGKKLLRTPVGDKYIAERLTNERLTLGGEPSGHTILHDVIGTGDGILVALKVLETLELTGNTHFETFTKYPQVIKNVRVTQKPDLSQEPYASYIQNAQKIIAGRILVRYSGTEPVLRIMVEAHTAQEAHAACQQLAQQFTHL